jgi:hypothetical protein
MTELWYRNPGILFEKYDEFFPNKNFNRIEKINSLARFAIYFAFLLILLNQDKKWLSISIVILIISLFLGTTENFVSVSDKQDEKNCTKPTNQNPFMNYTLGDLMEKPDRTKACRYEDSKDEMRKKFRSHLYSDSSDIWGKFISDRNFYTMPNTEIVNDQKGFAKWCFGNSGKCKTKGKNCLKIRDPTYHRGRLTTINYENDIVL